MCENLEINVSEPEPLEDDTIHFEGITSTEKRFINIVRNFRNQFWLSNQVSDLINDILTSLVTKSLEEKSIRNVFHAIKGENLKIDDVYQKFSDECDNIVENDSEMQKLTNFWYDSIMETIYGELKPIEEE